MRLRLDSEEDLPGPSACISNLRSSSANADARDVNKAVRFLSLSALLPPLLVLGVLDEELLEEDVPVWEVVFDEVLRCVDAVDWLDWLVVVLCEAGEETCTRGTLVACEEVLLCPVEAVFEVVLDVVLEALVALFDALFALEGDADPVVMVMPCEV